ncbi:hypothetical protein HZA86_03760 [Candidatus Uhrbacteria bacterium]|nr:hypothetical protein [Candidatus Uhrbacteria bacterium]
MKTIARTILEWWLHGCVRIALVRFRPMMIAIVGSTDKTTTKLAISAELRSHGHRVRAHVKSYNTSIGLPLAILNLESGGSSAGQWTRVMAAALWNCCFDDDFPNIIVVELGVDHPGEMRGLLRLITPIICVITTVTGEYVTHFGDLEAVAREFGTVAKMVPSDGLVVLNNNDLRVKELGKNGQAKIVRIGHAASSDAVIQDQQSSQVGQQWTLTYEGKQTTCHSIGTGRHNQFAESAAVVVDQWIDRHANQKTV